MPPATGAHAGFNHDADRARTEARMRPDNGTTRDTGAVTCTLSTPGGPGGVGGAH